MQELLCYYRNRRHLSSGQENISKLRSLIDDYNALLERLRQDPNLLKRVARATLGKVPADANTIYPRPTPEQLEAASKVLAEQIQQEPKRSVIQALLERLNQPWRRITLFLCGAALVLISFICFGAPPGNSGKAVDTDNFQQNR